MKSDDAIFLIYRQRNTSERFKMTKAKTAMFLVMIICSCGLILSLTDALPTPEPEALGDDTKLSNNSKLVITHVVKTIEFEVGIVDDDVPVDENTTDSNPSQFYETDIQLLNVDLLKEVMNQATSEENLEATMGPEQKNIEQIGNEGKTDSQMQNSSFPL